MRAAERTELIAQKNNEVRTNLTCQTHLTEGLIEVYDRDMTEFLEIIEKVRTYPIAYSRGDGSSDECDFGAFDHNGTKYFWKIDYYDKTFRFGEDPLSENCCRVLTVMRADEY